jgi:hypothetical protein
MWRSRKYLDAVRELSCQVGSPACDNRPGTIEPAHSDQMEDGKGKGIKAHDLMVAAACHSCHLWLGGSAPREERFWYMDRGIRRTIRAMADRGILKV